MSELTTAAIALRDRLMRAETHAWEEGRHPRTIPLDLTLAISFAEVLVNVCEELDRFISDRLPRKELREDGSIWVINQDNPADAVMVWSPTQINPE
jgi:hypothetical protein